MPCKNQRAIEVLVTAVQKKLCSKFTLLNMIQIKHRKRPKEEEEENKTLLHLYNVLFAYPKKPKEEKHANFNDFVASIQCIVCISYKVYRFYCFLIVFLCSGLCCCG